MSLCASSDQPAHTVWERAHIRPSRSRSGGVRACKVVAAGGGCGSAGSRAPAPGLTTEALPAGGLLLAVALLVLGPPEQLPVVSARSTATALFAAGGGSTAQAVAPCATAPTREQAGPTRGICSRHCAHPALVELWQPMRHGFGRLQQADTRARAQSCARNGVGPASAGRCDLAAKGWA